MANEFGTVGLTSGAIALNAIKSVEAKRDPFPVIFSGAVLLVVFVVLGGFRPRLGMAAAAVFFVASAIDSGQAVVSMVTKVSNSPKAVIKVPATTGSNGSSGFKPGAGNSGSGGGGSSSGSW